MRKILPLLAVFYLVSTAQADQTASLGLTLSVPSSGQTNWSQSFFEDFVEPISRHQHTGSGDGAQIVTASIANNAVDGTKIRLANNVALRARNAANSADIDLLKLNASDEAEFGGDVVFTGDFSLGTPLAVASGGTGAATAADARTNLGLVIGTNVQAYDADLAAIAGVVSDTDKLVYYTGPGAAGRTEFTSAARTLLAETSLASMTTSLGNAGGSGTFNSVKFRAGLPSDPAVTGSLMASSESGVAGLSVLANSTASRTAINFANTGGTVGSIVTSGTGTSYNTTSDERLKKDIVPAEGELTKLKALQIKEYSFKEDKNEKRQVGVLAQQAATIYPDIVTVPVDVNGNEDPSGVYMVDYSKLGPHLVVAVQELSAKVDTLEARIALLEQKK